MFAVVFRFVTGSIVVVMFVVPFPDADDELSKIQSEIKIKKCCSDICCTIFESR